ncbi:bacillithiol biosynthesis BshC, partial [Butyricicoccus sp. 1XD8-22]
MELEQMSLPVNNKLLSAYWSGSEKLHTFFEYKLHDTAFHKRAQYLKNMHYNTNELSNIIRSFMEPFGLSPKVNEHLSHLADGAKVIVGGQQAGILTGPLYSIHKAITVILLAKEQSEKLGEKILPLFWIAGEDHDLEEINHTYTIV